MHNQHERLVPIEKKGLPTMVLFLVLVATSFSSSSSADATTTANTLERSSPSSLLPFPSTSSPTLGKAASATSRLYWNNEDTNTKGIPSLSQLFFHNNNTIITTSTASTFNTPAEAIGLVLSRQLAEGDFSALNAQIFQGASIDIPGDFQTDAGPLWKFHIGDIKCRDIQIGDITLKATSSEDITGEKPPPNLPVVSSLEVIIEKLQFDCAANFRLEKKLTGDDTGSIGLASSGSTVKTIFSLESSQQQLAVSSTTQYCNADIQINDIDFQAGGLNVLGTIVDYVEGLFHGPVSDALSTTVCNEMKSVGSQALPEILNQLSEGMIPYLQPLEDSRTNPLQTEMEFLVAQQGATGDGAGPYMNFRDVNSSSKKNDAYADADADADASDLARLVLDGLDQIDAWLGSEMVDPATGTRDLAINSFLRDMLQLEDDGAFVWEMNDDQQGGLLLVESHDDLLQMKIALNRLTLRGLDTMTHLETLERIGNHTLESKMGWKFLSVQADITFLITPSTLDSSMWSQTNPGAQLYENVQLELRADDIQAILSLFAAIHQQEMGQVPLGSLFQSDAIASCLMSTLYPAQLISSFQVRVSNLVDPTIEGFTSPGLDRVLTELMDLMYNLYEHWLMKGLPNFAQTTIRDSVNEMWMKALDDLNKMKKLQACPLLDLPAEGDWVPFVDFRDLLLSAQEAKAIGGTGTQPYGDVVPSLFGLVDDQLLAVDQDDPYKRLTLNSFLLDPLTKEQSGTPGTIHFAAPLISIEVDNRNRRDDSTTSSSSTGGSVMEEIASSLFDAMELQVAGATVQNINTIVEPTSLLKTSKENPHLLKNLLQMGPIEGMPLNASVQVRLAVDPFDEQKVHGTTTTTTTTRRLQDRNNTDGDMIEHIMELGMSASGLAIAADIVAMIDATKLQNFHLSSIFNIDCWLATIAPPVLDEVGRATGNPGGFHVHGFFADFLDLATHIECVNEECSKAGLGVLTNLSKIWEQSKVTTTLGDRYELLAAELLTGDYLQNQMARWLDEAPTRCPHSEEYNTRPTVYPPLPLPLFSVKTIDTFVFTAMTAAQAGLLLLSEVDPGALGLSSASPEVPTTEANGDYIDFTSEGGFGSLGDVVTYVFGQASNMLGVDSGTGINAIVKDLLNDAGLLNLQFDGAPMYGDSNLQLLLNSVWVEGLDTFSRFDVLQAAGPHLLTNNIKLDRLSVKIDMSLVSGGTSQRVIVGFGAEDIEASLAIYAAVNSKALDAIELGSLLQISSILSCLFTAVEDIRVPTAELSIGRVSDISIEGLLPETNQAFSKSMAMIQSSFNIGIDAMLNPVLRGVMNGVVSSLRKNAVCTNIMASSPDRRLQESSGYIDFRDLFLSEQESRQYGGAGDSPYGDLFRTILGFVEDLILDVDPDTKLAAVNEMLISPLTKAISNESGSVIIPGNLVDIANRVSVGGLDATFTFRASEARIDNLDTLGDPIDLLSPVKTDAHMLNNTAEMGLPGLRPLRASVRILLGLEDGDGTDLRNDLELAMDMQTVSLVLTAALKVVETEFGKFPLSDIMNFDCWLAKMPASPLDRFGFPEVGADPSASISELVASVQQLGLKTTCFSCTSEGLENWNTEGSKDIQAATDQVVNYVTNVLGGKFLQVQIDRALFNAARRCPHSPEFDPNFSTPKYARFESDHDESSTTFLLMLLIVTAILVVVLAVVTIFVHCFVRARHQRLLKSLPDRQLFLLQKEQEGEDKRERELNAVTRSLFQSSATIPAYVRYLIPIVILGNIAFFLSGHLSLGATVNIEIQLAGQSFRIEEFFSFSMARSTIDIWNAGGKALAALIFIFSGLWPYTKQIITLVLWFMPPSRCSMERRGSILLWLDTLAKWSMVDIFVLLVSLAGFRVSIVSPDLDFLPDNFYSVDLLVVPVWGLYANMIAQIISQISSHFIIHYHRKVVSHSHRARRSLRKAADFLQQDVEEGSDGFMDERRAPSTASSSASGDSEVDAGKDKLCEHAFVRPHSENSKLVARSYVNPILIFAGVSLSALLITGCALPSFSLEVLGILGVFVESGNGWNQAVETHSVFSITEMLRDQARFVGGAGNYLGLGTLSALLVLTVLIVPLVQTVALLYHWLAPMTKETRRRMEVFLEALQAWQYVEVYIFATVVASWQFGKISEFMINAYCGSLESTFDMLVYYDILAPRDAQCFKVEASIESATFMLATSAILLGFLNTYITNASRQYFRDAEKRSKKGTQPTAVAVAVAEGHAPDDNVSAVSGPDQSAGAEQQPLAVAEFEGNEFNDETQEEEIHAVPLLGRAADDTSNKNGDEVHVDPLASPTATEEHADEHWRRSYAMEKIHPVPVLFTDKFRWTLRSQEERITRTVAVVADPTPVKEDPYLVVDTDTSSESHSQAFMVRGESHPLLMSGDAPDSIPPTPAQSTLDGDSIRETIGDEEFPESDEKFGDDADTYDTFKDEVVKVQNLESDWESESEDEMEDLFSGGETVDMSVSSLMDQSSNNPASDSVLLGSGNILLEPLRDAEEAFQDELDLSVGNASNMTEDSDILQQSTRVMRSSLREAEDNWRRDNHSTNHSTAAHSGTHSGSTEPVRNTTRPQGNSLLQAALLEDVEL